MSGQICLLCANVCLLLLLHSKTNEKYCDTHFNPALGALLGLVCCDQGWSSHVCWCSCYEQQQQSLQSCLCVSLTIKPV